MKKILFTMCLLLGTANISAQSTSQNEDAKTTELRQKIGIDYSMPDFNTSKIDGKVIGERLAKMLRLLQSNAKDPVYIIIPIKGTSKVLDAFIDNMDRSLAHKMTRFLHVT